MIVPIGSLDNLPACVWMSGRDPECDSHSRQSLTMLALYAAHKAQAFHARSDSPRQTRLSSREREVLKWIAAGKTSWEVSAILGVSEAAVNRVAALAMEKLGAVTRTQAVVIAIRNGEIAP